MTERIKEAEIRTAVLSEYTDFYLVTADQPIGALDARAPAFTWVELAAPSKITLKPVQKLEIEVDEPGNLAVITRVRTELRARLQSA